MASRLTADIIEDIVRLPVENGRITDETAMQIADLLEGDTELFWRLDNSPPRALSGGEWHFKLRQARNNHKVFWDRMRELGA